MVVISQAVVQHSAETESSSNLSQAETQMKTTAAGGEAVDGKPIASGGTHLSASVAPAAAAYPVLPTGSSQASTYAAQQPPSLPIHPAQYPQSYAPVQQQQPQPCLPQGSQGELSTLYEVIIP